MSFPQPYNDFEAKLHLLVREADGVLRVSFNRKPVNSWIVEMWRELRAIFEHIQLDSDVNAVVLSGEGRCFTAGLDLNSPLGQAMEGEDDVARKAWKMKAFVTEFQACLSSMELCDRPVIAAVHDVAFGLAIDLLSAVDIRYADTKARFSIKEVDAGLAADIGTLQRFPKIVGSQSVVRELAFTAREFDAEEALRIGFISRVVQGGREGVLSAAIETAKIIAAKSPIALRGTKALLLHARDHSVEEGLAYTALWSSAMLQSDDIPVAMLSVMQKQKPEFAKL